MTSDSALLLEVFRAACARLDAAALTRSVCPAIPPASGVVALGKMAHRQMRAALGERTDLHPLVSIGAECGEQSWEVAGDHPVPGSRSFPAGARLLARVREADGEPLVLLLSGGGSALAEAPAPGLHLADQIEATRLLLRSGLDIGRMNTVRRRLSAIKGGRLALAAPRSSWRVYVLSDVVGNDLQAIASGPCVADEAPLGEAKRICREAGLWEALPVRVRTHLEADDQPTSLHGIDVTSLILAGAGELAREAAAASPVPATLLPPVSGPVERCAERYLAWARTGGASPRLLIAAGEPTVRVTGPGRGGRAQHLALLMARGLAGMNATFLAAGTDGRDGDTAQAGAIVDGTLAACADVALEEAIRRFDAAPFHARFGTAIAQFRPVTHLGELHLLLVL